VPPALTTHRAARAPPAAVVDVLGKQARSHARLAEDHLHERVHRSHRDLSDGSGDKASRRTHQQ
jgi:hypothetical protein